MQGIDFATFTGHMCVGIVFVGFVGYGALRLLYRDINKLQNQDPPEIAGNTITNPPPSKKNVKDEKKSVPYIKAYNLLVPNVNTCIYMVHQI